ncbi:hybrid sensor histidine kinase/response regulator transcription factor [Dyadobacter crusticola]|uniref:hybrid sensor histidine kinase/response regulator transcription factor n=1 Tax=Dyadobacter crusticola TaxID=292407 RepID=UPI0004E1F353|nr:hybrid sensor histidine kinase/response regulator transcription factor [Dyadobacter crusticola]
MLIKAPFGIHFNLVWLLLGMTCANALSQASRTISTREGLPQSFVSGLEQDQAGFVWVGTRNGLARYDGVNFKVFQQNNSDKSILASNLIINIKKFNDKIWIEHESGEIDELNPVSELVAHHSVPMKLNSGVFLRRAWLADSTGTLWRIMDGKGLIKYGVKPKVYNRKSGGFDSDTLWGLCEGHYGRLWVLTRYGLSSLDRRTGKIKNFGSPQLPDYHDYRYAVRLPVALHLRSNGELMWADRRFLHFFSSATGEFLRKIPFDSQSDRGVSWIRTGPDGADYFERGGDLYRFKEDTGLALIYGKTREDKNPVQSFLVDKSGLVWFGTNAHGIFQVDLTTPFFPAFPIQDGFAGDVMKTAFNASLPALFDWKPKDQGFAASGYHIRSAYDKSGALWIGLKEKIVRYDPATKTFYSLPGLTQISNPAETGIGIKGLTISPEGAPVVIGYNRNVLIYHQDKKTWEWLVPQGEISRQFGTNVTPQDISMDRDRIWITTEMHGLIIINRRSGKMQLLKHHQGPGALPTNQLLGLKQDPSRPYLLWIGSRNGLICLDKKTLKAEIFNTNTGLPDNTIYTLLSDQYGNLWFGTNKGLCSFSPITHKVKVFQTRHGLLEDEFNRFHQLMLPDGRLAFGGTHGWTLFDPNKIKEDVYQPAVALTSLKINNETATQSSDGFLKQPLNAVDKLVLPHDQNTVTLFFAGLQYNQPQDLQYRFRLSGYDNEWINSGHIPFANYTKIPPGSYEFMVNASNTTGQWSNEIKKLHITVLPPWWRTWWAYLFYVLVIAGSVWYWMRLQTIKIELRKSVELKKQEAQQLRALSEMKERFFTNVTHDFRTPLTLILSPLTPLIQKYSGTSDGGKLLSVKRNAEQLLTLINQLLDFSRLNAGMLTVDPSAGDLCVFISHTLSLFREEALKKNINIDFNQQVSGDFWFDAAKLERMLSNLIGNALKFTPIGGRVEVSVTREQGDIVFSVADNGIGIQKERLAYVFDRYYRIEVNEMLAGKGSGIGLALVKELAELQGGRVEVESIEGRGSTFRIRMPYQSVDSGQEKTSVKVKTNEWEVPLIQDEEVRILLLEDNAELSDFIAESLPGRYKIERASNGQQGLEAALSTIPDLIISDVMMPVMDGFEFCQLIKQHTHTSHIPVILLTAKAAVESRMQGLTKGADDYLTKPFHVPELNLRVYNLLERQRKLRAYIQKRITTPHQEHSRKVTQELDPFLTRFYDVLDQDLDNSSVSVDELASRMNMSRSQLHRKLRAIADMTVSDVVRNYRLKKAAAFLRQGFNSSESAYKVGFDSPAYFSKCFRDVYNMTPSDYQKDIT